jgi:hypothetical protein
VSLDEDTAQTLVHNLGGDPADYVVDMQYRVDDVNGVNLRYYGGADFGANPAPGHVEDDRVAAYWRSLTSSRITVYRRPEDAYAPEVRIRIFVPVYRAVYIYDDDLVTAESYEELLEANDIAVDLLPLDEVASANLGSYNLVIVGPETGYQYSWGDEAAVGAIAQWGKPVLGLGYGGSSLFSELGLFIDWGQGWISSIGSTNVYAVDPDHAIWRVPYDIPVSAEQRVVELYAENSTWIAIYMPTQEPGVVALGRQTDNQNHYQLIEESPHLLWGFNDGPQTMTQTGKQVFINTVWHMLH